ncbi:phosphotransferase [Glycomyces paridis]|uniref:phosphotransferase n=1 Tax=Glycomyces paridis TaxID=2126555 RepID=UPI00195E1D6A|nr:aminoglycoside phosphotransferase family protein [Glycomyces paridis]
MELLASGRASAVYAVDDRTVLRRSASDCETEARLMRYLRGRGYPVPQVYTASGAEMTMERLYGPTLLDALLTGSVDLAAAAETLLALLGDLHRIEPPPWLAATARGVDLAATAPDRAVLHLDLHPGNVLLTDDGPQVIDWTNAAAGDPAVDRAVTWAILAEVDPSEVDSCLAAGLGPLLHRLAADLPPASLAVGVRFRHADPNVGDSERDRVRARLDGTSNADVIARIAAQPPVEVSSEEIVAYIEAGRPRREQR